MATARVSGTAKRAAQAVSSAGRGGLARSAGVTGSGASTANAATPSSSNSVQKATIDFSHLPVLTASQAEAKSVGRAFIFEDSYSRAILNTPGLPSTSKHDLSLTQQASTVLRKATVDVKEQLKPDTNARIVLDGTMGSGKSTVLLQTMAHAIASGWLVLYIPNAKSLVDGTYSYTVSKSPDAEYEQRGLAQGIIQNFLGLNREALKKLGGSAVKGLEEAAKKPEKAMEGLRQIFPLAEQNKQTPLLLAIDDTEALLRPTAYISTQAETLDPSDFAVPRLLLDYINGKSKLSNGAVIAAVNGRTDQSANLSVTSRVEVPKLDRTEAAGIFRHLSDLKLLSSPMSDSSFMERYVMSDGLAMHFTRGIRDVPGGTSRGVLKKGRRRGVAQRDDKLQSLVA